jgi:Protein of unknown function (DUF1761)
MLEINSWVAPLAALIPMIIGFVWYNPKVFGIAWMNAADLTEEKLKNTSMGVVLFVCFIFSCMLALTIMQLTIHQMGFQSVLMDEPGFGTQGSDVTNYFSEFMSKYGSNYRTFKHGAFHGFIAGLFFAMPILGINALFERKSWKYILIHTGYWAITLMLMGGVICQFA